MDEASCCVQGQLQSLLPVVLMSGEYAELLVQIERSLRLIIRSLKRSIEFIESTISSIIECRQILERTSDEAHILLQPWYGIV